MLQMAKFLSIHPHPDKIRWQTPLPPHPPFKNFFFSSFWNPGTLILGLSTSNTINFALGQFTNYHNPLLKRSENGTSYLSFIKKAHAWSSTFSVSLYEVRVWALSTQFSCQAVLKNWIQFSLHLCYPHIYIHLYTDSSYHSVYESISWQFMIYAACWKRSRPWQPWKHFSLVVFTHEGHVVL